jgi:hypothetical protein
MLLPFLSVFEKRMRRWRTVIMLSGGLYYHASALAAPIENAPRLEYQVKAGYLFNFLRFTEWPPQALPEGAPYRIGVMSDTAAFTVIAEALKGKTLNNRQIEVISLKDGDSLHGCHLVFIPRTAGPSALDPAGASQPEGILMVGESENFALRNGMIGFVLQGHNIRFQVNLSAAQDAGLKLSGRLASLAEIVRRQSP